jgi:tetratricopeptide (TPR) repeat protein
MSLRFRRSIRIAPGVRLNLTKRGIGLTAGVRGAHYSVHSSGAVTRSVGLPGTGLYYQDRRRAAAGAAASRQAAPRSTTTVPTAPAVPPATLVPGPGLLASAAERAYHRGVLAYLAGDGATAAAAFEEALAHDPSATSAHLFAGVAASNLDDGRRAAAHLEAVVASPAGLPDRLQAHYLPERLFAVSLAVKITASITARLPASELAAALMLAEVYQEQGRLEEAIGVVHQVHEALPSPLVRLSLCDLLLADRDYAGVVETAAGVANESDVEVEILHVRAAAQVALDQRTGALDSFKAALAKTAGRDPGLLLAVRYDRALALERFGQHAKARADLERVYAADPAYEDVAARLGAPKGTS